MPDTQDPVKDAVAFILENSSVSDSGKRNSTKSAYFDFMKGQGVPKAQVQAVAEAESRYVSGAVRVAADDLVAKVAAAKKAGDDPNDLRSEVVLPTSNGRIDATVTAHSTARVPRTGETIDRFGATKVSIRIGSAIKRPAAEYARDAVTAAMKG